MRVPTIKELYESIVKDLKNKLNVSDDDLRKVLNAFAGVTAAQLKFLYLYLNDIRNNQFPDTADLAVNGGELERLGRLYLNREPRAATAGVFQVAVSGLINSSLRNQLSFKSNDDAKNPGQLYITDTEKLLTGLNDLIEIRSTGGGTDFLLDVGDKLTITEPVIGVDQTVTIVSVVSQPKAAEKIEDYRQSILNAIQLEPQGGARTDYRGWATDAQGVRRVYPYVQDGDAGTVEIYVEATQDDSTDGLGTPSDALLDDVKEVVEFDPDDTKLLKDRGRRPIQANVVTLPIKLIPVDIDIINLNLNTLSIQNTIESNVNTFLRNVRPFIDGADLLRNKNDVLYAARMQSVVSDSLDSSNFFTDFQMKVSGTETTTQLFTKADIPYLRNINYV